MGGGGVKNLKKEVTSFVYGHLCIFLIRKKSITQFTVNYLKDVFYHLFYIFISFWTKEQQQIDLAFEAIRADSLNLHFLVHFLCATQPRRAFALALSDSNLKKVFSLTRKKKLILEFSLIITRQLSYIKYLLASAQSPF